MNKFNDFSETERKVLKRALGFAGRNIDWTREEIQSLDQMKNQLEKGEKTNE